MIMLKVIKVNSRPALVILALALIPACSSKTKAEENLPKFNSNQIMASPETVTGIVGVNDNGGGNIQVVIEIRKDSKSVVSYEVTGAQKDAVAAKKGQTVTATGMVRNLSPFHKLIDVSQLQ
jgi:hypothetical protein